MPRSDFPRPARRAARRRGAARPAPRRVRRAFSKSPHRRRSRRRFPLPPAPPRACSTLRRIEAGVRLQDSPGSTNRRARSPRRNGAVHSRRRSQRTRLCAAAPRGSSIFTRRSSEPRLACEHRRASAPRRPFKSAMARRARWRGWRGGGSSIESVNPRDLRRARRSFYARATPQADHHPHPHGQLRRRGRGD